jgi:hypothetical protein
VLCGRTEHIADTGERPSADDMAEYFRVHDTYWMSDSAFSRSWAHGATRTILA